MTGSVTVYASPTMTVSQVVVGQFVETTLVVWRSAKPAVLVVQDNTTSGPDRRMQVTV